MHKVHEVPKLKETFADAESIFFRIHSTKLWDIALYN